MSRVSLILNKVIPQRARLRGVVVPLSILSIWTLSSQRHWVNENLLPGPALVLKTAVKHVATGNYWLAVVSSLGRAIAGYALALAVGLVLGVVLGKSRVSNRIGGPLFNAFRQVAPFAWIPLISAWFGGGELTKIVFITTVAFTPITLNTIEGVRAIAREQLELGRVVQLTRWQTITAIAVPSAMPRIMAGAQLGLMTAWLATVGAEFFLNIAPGVTMYLIEGRMLGEMDLVLVGIATIGVIGFGLNATCHAVERYALRWRTVATQ